ncbi:hypothetical protein LCGC14_1650510 [marine sediment metagenome]|uniref:Uncharacterized protein n=1 Tax=marine sediment metagenome TaxID=412755 RepID=A0A0F9HWY3_9ZZZZ
MKYEVACTLCGHNQIYSPRNSKTPKKPHTTCKSCGKDFSIDIGISETVSRIPKSPKKILLTKSNPKQPPQVEGLATPPTTPINAVGDPVGFVTSIITEELMKTRDVRWATLFVSVLRESKKLDYSTQQEVEWSNQAKSLSIEELVEKVAIKGSISKNISRRLEKADDTSPLDSFSDV